VEIEVSPAAAIGALLQAILPAGDLQAAGRVESPPAARIGCHTTTLRLNSISPTAKLAGDEIRRSEIGTLAAR
jgi:hypothetical protein